MTTVAETKTLTVMAALNEALDEAMAADSRVFLLGEDLADPAGGVVGVTKGLSTKYGTRPGARHADLGGGHRRCRHRRRPRGA